MLKADLALLALSFIISIIYIGSWITFLAVRLIRVIWGFFMQQCSLRIYKSRSGQCMMKADWIFRLITVILYLIVAFATSVRMPELFCDFIGQTEDGQFTSCKWQVFGFRFIFILLGIPLEMLLLAVVYRFATDMVFKI